MYECNIVVIVAAGDRDDDEDNNTKAKPMMTAAVRRLYIQDGPKMAQCLTRFKLIEY